MGAGETSGTSAVLSRVARVKDPREIDKDEELMEQVAIYPGTFDPIHNGHTDLIARASRMFDRVIVAVAISTGKRPRFSVDERMGLVERIAKPFSNVEVDRFDGLLIHFAAKRSANVVVRGLRAVSDFEFELQLASMNRKMAPELETVFLTPDEGFSYVSSTLVREISMLGGDIRPFVDPVVVEAFGKVPPPE